MTRKLHVAALAAIFLLILGAHGAAAYDIYEIHTAGPLGGLIVIDGDIVDPPEGACGVRWDPAVEWHWGSSPGSPTITGSGDTLSYVVGYETCANPFMSYFFNTPGVMGGVPADNVLVAQAWPSDIEWIDENWQPIEVGGGGGGGGGGICQIFDCPISEFTFKDVCDLNPWNCAHFDGLIQGLSKTTELSRSIVYHLDQVRALIADPNARDRERLIDEGLAIAKLSGEAARKLLKDADDERRALQQSVGSQSHPALLLTVGSLSAGVELGSSVADSCRQQVADLAASSQIPSAAEVAATRKICAAATDGIATSLDSSVRGRGFGLTADAANQ